MSGPALENLEVRTLLSGVVLGAGDAALFDFDANGVNDGVLVNYGDSDIEYTYSLGDALDRIDVLADGAKFATNMAVVDVGDTDLVDDFHLECAKIGIRVR